MNRNLIMVAGLVVLMLATACTRTYTCRCDGGALGSGINIDIENKTKDEAQKECDTHNSKTPFSYHNCHLK
jgi:hypothetical protein